MVPTDMEIDTIIAAADGYCLCTGHEDDPPGKCHIRHNDERVVEAGLFDSEEAAWQAVDVVRRERVKRAILNADQIAKRREAAARHGV